MGGQAGMHWKGGSPPPPPRRASSLRPAIVPLSQCPLQPGKGDPRSHRRPTVRRGGGGGQWCIRTAVHRRRRGGLTLPPSSPSDDRQHFASVPRGFKLKFFWPAFGGGHRGTPLLLSSPPPPALLQPKPLVPFPPGPIFCHTSVPGQNG